MKSNEEIANIGTYKINSTNMLYQGGEHGAQKVDITSILSDYVVKVIEIDMID